MKEEKKVSMIDSWTLVYKGCQYHYKEKKTGYRFDIGDKTKENIQRKECIDSSSNINQVFKFWILLCRAIIFTSVLQQFLFIIVVKNLKGWVVELWNVKTTMAVGG